MFTPINSRMLLALAFTSLVAGPSYLAGQPAAPTPAAPATAGGATPPAAPAAAPGARGGRAARPVVDFGPLPEIHAPVPNTLPGLLGKPLKWKSTAPLVVPQNDDTHFLFSIKDPTIAFINGKWEIYATANMVMGPQAGGLS